MPANVLQFSGEHAMNNDAVCILNKSGGARGDGLSGKVFATQNEDLSLDPQHPYKKSARRLVCNPSTGKLEKWMDLWSQLTGQLSNQ